jgi:hypothetical protein
VGKYDYVMVNTACGTSDCTQAVMCLTSYNLVTVTAPILVRLSDRRVRRPGNLGFNQQSTFNTPEVPHT